MKQIELIDLTDQELLQEGKKNQKTWWVVLPTPTIEVPVCSIPTTHGVSSSAMATRTTTLKTTSTLFVLLGVFKFFEKTPFDARANMFY